MEYAWHDFVGNIGVVLVLATYLLLQLGRVDGRTVMYSALNALGAVLILISLLIDFNLSSFIIEIAWLVISVIGIWVNLKSRRSSPATVQLKDA